jgi:hypothetical protein
MVVLVSGAVADAAAYAETVLILKNPSSKFVLKSLAKVTVSGQPMRM